jgi:hypothetical protein
VNAILERIHAVVMNMLCTAEIDMVDLVKPSDIDVFLSDLAWAIHSTHHIVLKASPDAAILDETAETVADPYQGEIPLARVNAFQEPFASRQVIQQDTSNIRRANQYLKHTETCMKYSFPPIATE